MELKSFQPARGLPKSTSAMFIDQTHIHNQEWKSRVTDKSTYVKLNNPRWVFTSQKEWVKERGSWQELLFWLKQSLISVYSNITFFLFVKHKILRWAKQVMFHYFSQDVGIPDESLFIIVLIVSVMLHRRSKSWEKFKSRLILIQIIFRAEQPFPGNIWSYLSTAGFRTVFRLP